MHLALVKPTIPANLQPKVMAGATVKEYKEIRKYGSLANYDKYVAAEKLAKEKAEAEAKKIEDEIKSSGLQNATDAKDYKTRYDNLSAESKKYVATPTEYNQAVKEMQKTLIKQNKPKIREQIQKYEEKLIEVRNKYDKEVDKFRDRGEDKIAEEKKTKGEAEREYYEGILRGLRDGIGVAANYNDIVAYAKEIGNYEKDRYMNRGSNKQPTIKSTITSPNYVNSQIQKTTHSGGRSIYIPIEEINKAQNNEPVTAYTSPDKTGAFVLNPTLTKTSSNNYNKPERVKPVQEKVGVYIPIEEIKPEIKPTGITAYTGPDKTSAFTLSPGEIKTFNKNKQTRANLETKQGVYTRPEKRRALIPLTTAAVQTNIEQPKTTTFNFLEPKKSDVEIVREMLKEPSIKSINRGVTDKQINQLESQGEIDLSNGLKVVTEEYYKKEKVRANSRVAYWVVKSKDKASIKNEINYALQNLNLADAPLGRKTTGVFETDMANVKLAQDSYKLQQELKQEVEKKVQEFKADPEHFKGAQAQSTQKGIVWTMGDDFVKNLPAYKKIKAREQAPDKTIKEAQQFARDIRLSPGGVSKPEAWSYSKRAARLAVGSIGTTYGKLAVGLPIGLVRPFVTGFQSTFKKNDQGKLIQNDVKYKQGSLASRILQTPETPELSSFRFTKPSTYNQAPQYLGELMLRPEAVTKTSQVIASAVLLAGSVGNSYSQSYKAAKEEALIKGTKLNKGAKLSAASTATGELASRFSLIRVQPGIIGAGYMTTKEAQTYQANNKGFIKLKISGKQPEYPSTPKMVSNKIVHSKTTIKSPEIVQTKNYIPGEITDKTSEVTDKVFAYTTAKYSALGVTPEFSGSTIRTTSSVFPYLTKTYPGQNGGSRTTFKRKETIETQIPYQQTRYTFGLSNSKVYARVKGKVIAKSPIIAKNGEEYYVPTKTYTKPIRYILAQKYIEPSTGETFFGKTNLIKTGGRRGYSLASEGLTRVQPELKSGSSFEKIKGITRIKSGSGFKEVKSFKIGGKTLTNPSGKPVRGAILPSKTTSTLRVYGNKPYTKIIKGRTEVFYPESSLMFGGGHIYKPSIMEPSVAPIGASSASPLTTLSFAPVTNQYSFLANDLAPGIALVTLSSIAYGQKETQQVYQTPQVSTQTQQVQQTQQVKEKKSPPIIIGQTIGGSGSAGISTPSPEPAPGEVFNFGIRIPKIKKRKVVAIGQTTPAYAGYVMTEGKYKKVTEKPVPKSKALDVISRIIDNTISAQGKVKPTGKKIKMTGENRGDGYYKRNKDKFRGFKILKGRQVPVKNTIIEKRNRRLDTPGETQQMTVAQYRGRQSRFRL